MLILGIETSCDETGIALYDSERGLLAHALHTQIAMHQEYGGVVPELASRDHIRRVLPLIRRVMQQAGAEFTDLDAVAYTQGPGLAGALLVGTSVANALAFTLGIPALGIHHLEGHLLSPLLASNPPRFPFVALLVSGGHTQLMRVAAVGEYELLGETVDDAAGEAFDKTAHLLGLGYPGGPALAQLAAEGRADKYKLPRPMLEQMHKTGNLDFSFSGLKTAVMLLVRQKHWPQSAVGASPRPEGSPPGGLANRPQSAVGASLLANPTASWPQSGVGASLRPEGSPLGGLANRAADGHPGAAADGHPDAADKADIAASFQEAIVDVLVAKSLYALEQTGLNQLVVAGGVGANRRLRERLDRAAAEEGYAVFYPEFEFCTDNGAMIALAGALRLGCRVVGAREDSVGASSLANVPEGVAGERVVGASLCPGRNPLEGLAIAAAERSYAFTVKPRWNLSTSV